MTHAASKLFYAVYTDHVKFPDKWFLDEPLTSNSEEIDAREFTEGVPYHGTPPDSVPVAKPGKEVAFHLAAFDMPVVSYEVAEVLSRIAPDDVECFPVEVKHSKASYAILNAICLLDCLDESKSDVTRWSAEDGRPDRLGQIHVISTLRIDPDRTFSHHIFRLKDWPLTLLVSDLVKDSLEHIHNLGVVFEPVV